MIIEGNRDLEVVVASQSYRRCYDVQDFLWDVLVQYQQR